MRELRSIIGENTDVIVSFDYHPKEDATHDCPACDAEIENMMVEEIAADMSRKDITRYLQGTTKERLRVECLEAENRSPRCWNPSSLNCDCPACGGYND